MIKMWMAVVGFCLGSWALVPFGLGNPAFSAGCTVMGLYLLILQKLGKLDQ
jgi:hypothetical protein